MKTPVPTTYPKASALGEKMYSGLMEWENILHVMHNTAVLVRSDLTAAGTAEDAFHAAREAKLGAYREQDTASANADAFILKAVDSLKTVFGRKWSAAWTQVGFSQSLALPRTFPRRLEVLRALETFYTGHTGAEEPDKGLTHQAAKALYEALRDAANNVTACATEARTKRDARDVALKALCQRERNLIKELSGLLSRDDPRWKAFGLNIPDDPAAPAKVLNVVVTPLGTGEIEVNFDPSVRADRYHVELLVGAETEFQRVATVYDTNADLTGLTPGAVVKVRVVAANAGGESAPSAVVEATVPMAIAA